MTKLLTLFVFVLMSSGLIGQPNFVERKEKYLISEKFKWIPDATGNVLFFNDNNLYKAENGQLPTFSQSVRATGEITQLLPINAFKTILFSQDQQQICILDNTFSINGECIDLEDYNIQNAVCCAVSSRSNVLYVFDAFNSSLYLIDLIEKKTIQSVVNMNALLGQELEIHSCREHNNDLFLLTKDRIVYVFDMFLNLKGQLEETYNSLNFWRDYIISLNRDKVQFNSLKNNLINLSISAPKASSVKVEGNSFYFSDKGVIMAYELKSQ